jgi:glucokinase
VGVLEIGGTHVTSGLVGLQGQPPTVLDVDRMSWKADAPATELLEILETCMKRLSAGRSLPWGIAIPGPFDYARGVALFEGVGKFDALHGVDVGAELSERLEQPRESLTFINDASAFVLGEWLAGAAQGVDRVLGITLGTGVGSAFVRDGVLVEDGDDVPPHGHVYLLTYDGRPIEDTVSRRALLRRYTDIAEAPANGLDVRDLADLARVGDTAASLVFREAFRALGETLAPWVERFGAHAVVIGGSIAGAWDLVEPPLSAGLGDALRLGECSVVRARAPEAAVLGAGWYAAEVRTGLER